jgi:hypothetical protein
MAVFVVEKDGTITNAKVVGINDPELNKALTKVLYSNHSWTAGKYLGFNMRYRVYLPLSPIKPNPPEVVYNEDLLSEL